LGKVNPVAVLGTRRSSGHIGDRHAAGDHAPANGDRPDSDPAKPPLIESAGIHLTGLTHSAQSLPWQAPRFEATHIRQPCREPAPLPGPLSRTLRYPDPLQDRYQRRHRQTRLIT
jgi:hypothetical protein